MLLDLLQHQKHGVSMLLISVLWSCFGVLGTVQVCSDRGTGLLDWLLSGAGRCFEPQKSPGDGEEQRRERKQGN